jgi:benzoate-CoA ligase
MAITFPERFNMATYFLDDRIEEGFGNKIAVYCGAKQYTYREVQQMANEVGNVLLRLGVEMEDRVLIVLPDSIEFVATWFGVAKIGAVITMVNTILPAADYEYFHALTPNNKLTDINRRPFARTAWRTTDNRSRDRR